MGETLSRVGGEPRHFAAIEWSPVLVTLQQCMKARLHLISIPEEGEVTYVQSDYRSGSIQEWTRANPTKDSDLAF